MDASQYGPFANVVAIACALVATFSVLLLKMLGGVKRWAWLTTDSPPFLVTAGARVLTVALMAATYVTIESSNYGWFAAGAVAVAVFGFINVARFDRLRRLHVVDVPEVGQDGHQLLDKRKTPLYKKVVIATESQLRPEAAEALRKARERSGGLSLRQFMAGYGAQKLNDPEALWDRSLLVGLASKLTRTLMYVVLAGVLTLFLAAFVIEVAG